MPDNRGSYVADYLIISGMSLVAALVTFWVGGSVAEITGQDEGLGGLAIKAGGPIGGFIIIFRLSLWTIERLQRGAKMPDRITLEVPMDPEPDRFQRGHPYKCTYSVFDPKGGATRDSEAKPVWSAGFLTLFVRDVAEGERITVAVKDGTAQWGSEDFTPDVRKVKLTRLSGGGP